jgi:hypothetical protein
MPPATMLQRNPNEFEDLDDMERVSDIQYCANQKPLCTRSLV